MLGLNSFLVLISCTTILGAPRRQTALRVCDLLQQLAKLDGKLVAARGTYEIEAHGSILLSDDCDSGARYKLPGVGWAVWLAVPDEADALGARRAKFQVEAKSFKALEHLARLPASARRKVVLTIVGQLTTFNDFRLTRTPQGAYIGNGFGPSGLYPAVVVIKAVEHIVSKP